MTLMCRVLAVSRAGYYAWCQRPPSARAQQDAALTRAIRRLHDGSRQTYGSPRIHRALQAEAVHCGRKRVVLAGVALHESLHLLAIVRTGYSQNHFTHSAFAYETVRRRSAGLSCRPRMRPPC